MIDLAKYKDNAKLYALAEKFNKLLSDLEQRDIPAAVRSKITEEIQQFEASDGNDSELLKSLSKSYNHLLTLVRTELGLHKKGHYQTLGIATGMPLGLLLGMFTPIPFAMGPAIGLLFGLIFGGQLDAKVKKEGKQLNI